MNPTSNPPSRRPEDQQKQSMPIQKIGADFFVKQITRPFDEQMKSDRRQRRDDADDHRQQHEKR